MNPFRSFFRNEAHGPALQGAVINPVTGEARMSYVPRATANDGRTAHEREFGTPLYVSGIEWRRGRASFPGSPAISRELLADVLREAGSLWSSEAQKRVAEIAAQLKRADEQLCENAFSRISGILPEYFSRQIDAAIAAGTQPPPVPSYAERMAQTVHVRKALHKRKTELFAEAFAVLKPGVLKFTKAAWSTCKALDREERGGILQRWRMGFVPSPALCALAYLALRAGEPISQFEEVGMILVTTDPMQIWGYLLEQQRPALPMGLTLREVREQQRAEEDRRRSAEMTTATFEHKRKVAELNKFNDAIRKQMPVAPPLAAEPEAKEPTEP
jgi:hypothetical protein